MKKLLILISAVVFAFGFSGVCVGALFTIEDTTYFSDYGTTASGDLDSYGGEFVNKLEYSGDWVEWTHYYNFNPSPDTILWGELEIYLKDDENDNLWNLETWEFGIGWGEDGSMDLGDVDTGIYEYNVNIGYLADGKFTISLASLWGDFYIDYSRLTIDYESNSASVPESSIMFLLGPSLIVLGLFSRRKTRK